MLPNLLFVDRQDGLGRQPVRDLRGHFASSRKVLRYFRMTLRAASMSASNSGSYGVISTPLAVSIRVSVSPFSILRRARTSFGRMTPTELPIAVTLIFKGPLMVIT